MDSTPTPSLSAYLSYRDAPAALDWLEATGFEVVLRQDAPDGTVTHAEATLGAAAVMVSTAADATPPLPPLRDRSTGAGLYLAFATAKEVDGWFARAIAAGGRAVIEPEDTEWGARRARVLDPAGREWSAGTHVPGGRP